MFKRYSSTLMLMIATAWLAAAPAWNSIMAFAGTLIAYITVEILQHQEGTKNRQSGGDIAGKTNEPLVIHQAHYGIEGRMRDVTDVVRGYVQEGRLSIIVANSILGGDPAEWQVKKLKVQYSFHGVSNEVSVDETKRLQLP